MDNEMPGDSSSFFRAVMTGLAVGIGATILCLIYNLIYRDSGNYFPTILISVSSLIFGVNILFLIIGFIFAAFIRGKKTGEIFFSAIFLLLTILGFIAATHINRTPDPYMNHRFRGLLTGIILILGLSATVAIPLLYHNKGFHKYIV
jgi:hypothetical protein